MSSAIVRISDDRVSLFPDEINEILDILKFNSLTTIITDESQVSDFLISEIWHFAAYNEDGTTTPINCTEEQKNEIIYLNTLSIEHLSHFLKEEINPSTKIIDIAEKLYFSKKIKNKTLH